MILNHFSKVSFSRFSPYLAVASRQKGTAFEYDFEGEGIKWFGHFYDDAGRSQVLIDGQLIDGQLIAVVDQYGPVRGQPFAWQHQGLPAGKHTIRIEVSGDKAPASRDTWSNVIGFGPPGADHPGFGNGLAALDLKRLDARLVASAPEATHALAVVAATDAAGQTIRLRDFGTAGQGGLAYSSWLPARNALHTPFSTANPWRSAVAP